MIGATGTQPAGRSSAFFPSGVLRKLWAKPIQQVSSPVAHGSEHQILRGQRAALDDPGALRRCRDWHEHGCVVEDLTIWLIEQ